jgi:hypothetical protein
MPPVGSPRRKRILWWGTVAIVAAAIPLTLLATAAFPVVLAFALHLASSTRFLLRRPARLLKHPARASLPRIAYWMLSNALFLALTVWALLKAREGLLFL